MGTVPFGPGRGPSCVVLVSRQHRNDVLPVEQPILVGIALPLAKDGPTARFDHVETGPAVDPIRVSASVKRILAVSPQTTSPSSAPGKYRRHRPSKP